MTTAVLCQNIAAVQSAPAGGSLPVGSNSINPTADTAPINTQTQAFQLTVTGSGNVSASAQIIVSNDGVNWASYGSAIAATSGASPNLAIGSGAQPWQFFSAYITAISGTGAKATVTMAS